MLIYLAFLIFKIEKLLQNGKIDDIIGLRNQRELFMYKNKQKITVSNYYFFLTPKRCGSFYLVQAGESFLAKESLVPEHEQMYFELTYALDGSALCYANDRQFRINAHDCFFSFPGERHKIESDAQKPLHFIFLAFFAKKNTKESRYIDLLQSAYSKDARVLHIEEIMPQLTSIPVELKKDDEYTPRKLRALIENMLIECCRKIGDKPQKSYPVRYSDGEMLTKDIISYVGENAAQISSVEALADFFNYSAQNISRIFRFQTGISLGKYINGKRMELADRLLGRGAKVTEVSERLGFSSIHTFSRAYKNYFHVSPSAKSRK